MQTISLSTKSVSIKQESPDSIELRIGERRDFFTPRDMQMFVRFIAEYPYVIEDSGWKAISIGHRGLTDFTRKILFSRALSFHELHSYELKLDNPGNQNILVDATRQPYYMFTATLDSSD